MLITVLLSIVLLAVSLCLFGVKSLAGPKDGFKPGHACRLNKSRNK